MTTRALIIALTLMAPPLAASAQEPKGRDEFDYIGVSTKLRGRIIDHTNNHGQDNRIWSRSLHQWRDLYIYLPPAFDRNQAYPIIYFLHPFALDERTFLWLIPTLDDAIARGKLPPCVIVAPDGSIPGQGGIIPPGSFFLNSNAGPYEDFILHDVWDFVCQRYPIRTERNAHVLVGSSMGGFAAFNLGIRHRYAFGSVIGLLPPLNLRWADSNGNPRAKFDPRSWGWRTGFDDPNEIVANYHNLLKFRMGQIVRPVFGDGDEALLNISANNPIELVTNTGLRNGELSMFVGYAGRDEFNIDAQVESFLAYARFRGLSVAVAYEPDGHHDLKTAMKFVPTAIRWLAPQIAPYSPIRYPAAQEPAAPARAPSPEPPIPARALPPGARAP
jgi:S-formylglutathione hydrolase FrmB